MTSFHTFSSDSIFALATALQGSQRAIIRLSGANVHGAIGHLLEGDTSSAQWRELSAGRLCNADIPVAGGITIPCLLYKMRAPRSFTGENMAEIHTVASVPLLRALFEKLRQTGLRQAEPGEFSRRAFVNGKISLTQAQGIAAMIQARDSAELQRAHELLRGDYAKILRAFSTELLDCLGLVEINIDFSDQGIDLLPRSDLAARLTLLSEQLEKFSALHATRIVERSAPRIALAGLASAGKSTLFNALLGHKRAIVDSKPGTTRDALEAQWALKDLPVILIDTAGFKIPATQLDEYGLQSAADAHSRADIIVWVADIAANPGENEILIDRIRALNKPCVLALNKCDLPLTQSPAWKKRYDSIEPVYISALSGQGLDRLHDRLAALLHQLGERAADYEVTAHHLAKLHESSQNIRAALAAIDKGASEDLIAADLHHALHCLGEITGEWTPDTVLDHIFKNFCIGK